MRNRAKCKLCNDVIESFHRHDWVECSCKEISIDGGQDSFKCAANNWENFLRIDDQDKEHIIKLREEENAPHSPITSKKDLVDAVNQLIGSYESLPQGALSEPVTGYDLLSVLLLLSAILKLDCKDAS